MSYCKRCQSRLIKSQHLEEETLGEVIRRVQVNIAECVECSITIVVTIPIYTSPEIHSLSP